MSHVCEAVVLHCIDFRFHSFIRKFLVEKLNLQDKFDLVSVAGAVKDIVRDERNVPKESILKQIEIAKRLHQIKRVILINHQNCGAYGPSLESGSEHEFETHSNDLKKARDFVLKEFPDLSVSLYFAKLNGEIEEI